ncbi:MAG: N-acetyl-gamma-glutamyl-phosphate reductase [Bacteroidaceae bacterium]|nr:N-acetyl-gamma-glutamyl-phosphate reductase [Bacteroidaceae bacterium]
MIKVGILGAAGYTGGELIRLLLNHPEVEIVFANSESNAGNKVYDVHEGLIGETELEFSSEMPFDQVDVVYFCFGHGKSEAFLKEHEIPANVKIIDLAQDFRIKRPLPTSTSEEETGSIPTDWVYGLPEIHREETKTCQHLANPGCFATCIQEGLLPLAKAGLLTNDISVNAITGSTGAGQKPGATTHFSWRNNNFSTYKLFTHQHLHEICQTLNELRPEGTPRVVDTLDEGFDCPALSPSQGEPEGISIDFIPYRGDFARGIFCTETIKLDKAMPAEEIVALYKGFFKDAAFTHYSDKALDLKQVVNTNKALVHVDVFGRKVVVTSMIDNLLKGAVGQAVQNMNIMFGIDERSGLNLKASAF